MIKKLGAFLLTALLLCVLPLAAKAAPPETLTRTQTFETSRESDDYDLSFENEIREDGQLYALESVEYEVLSQRELTKPETLTHRVQYKNLPAREANASETTGRIFDGQSVTLKLKSVEYFPVTGGERTAVVTSSVDYGAQTSAPAAPRSRNVSYYDSETDTSVAVTIPLVATDAATGWRWVRDVRIPITFKVYNALYYEFEGKRVPFNDEVPQIDGIKGDILRYLELDNRYRIDSVKWVSDVYMADGVEYRDAEAAGSRWAADFTARYSGTVTLQASEERYNAIAYYETVREVPTGEVIKTVEAAAIYRILPEKKSGGLTTAAAVAIGAGIALLAGAVILILVIIAKKRKKKDKRGAYYA